MWEFYPAAVTTGVALILAKYWPCLKSFSGYSWICACNIYMVKTQMIVWAVLCNCCTTSMFFDLDFMWIFVFARCGIFRIKMFVCPCFSLLCCHYLETTLWTLVGFILWKQIMSKVNLFSWRQGSKTTKQTMKQNFEVLTTRDLTKMEF